MKNQDSLISELSIEIFKNSDASFGYMIYEDSILKIKQNSVPTLQGETGFIDSSSALKVAEFVVDKMKRGIIPPTIFEKEIDSLINIKQ